MRFEKWQALGNDYLIVEQHELPFELTPARVRRLCQPHFGVGADGVLLVARSEQPAAGEPGTSERAAAGSRSAGSLRIFNPDGSEAELSGNGAREAALYMHAHGWAAAETFSIETTAGTIRPTVLGPGCCRIELPRARTSSQDFPGGPPDGVAELEADGRPWRFQHVSIGNPQCAIALTDTAELAALDLGLLGPAIESHSLFPNRTNVSWYVPLDAAVPPDAPPGGATRIRARIFERGVGETLSSGTGAAGAAVAHVLAMRRERPGTMHGERPVSVTVVLDGGELDIEVGEDLSLTQAGWAAKVFEGRLSEELLGELRATREERAAGAP
jgi:diaminopimelate epimerase